jgi:hypothetical protein
MRGEGKKPFLVSGNWFAGFYRLIRKRMERNRWSNVLNLEHLPREIVCFQERKFFGRKMSHSYLCRPLKRPVRLRARTPPFHGGDTGSNPVRATRPFSAAGRFFYWQRCECFRISRQEKNQVSATADTKGLGTSMRKRS